MIRFGGYRNVRGAVYGGPSTLDAHGRGEQLTKSTLSRCGIRQAERLDRGNKGERHETTYHRLRATDEHNYKHRQEHRRLAGNRRRVGGGLIVAPANLRIKRANAAACPRTRVPPWLMCMEWRDTALEHRLGKSATPVISARPALVHLIPECAPGYKTPLCVRGAATREDAGTGGVPFALRPTPPCHPQRAPWPSVVCLAGMGRGASTLGEG